MDTSSSPCNPYSEDTVEESKARSFPVEIPEDELLAVQFLKKNDWKNRFFFEKLTQVNEQVRERDNFDFALDNNCKATDKMLVLLA